MPTSGGANTTTDEPLPVLILVICLAVSVLLLLIVIVVCVIRKRNKESQNSAPSSPESQRPFSLPDQQTQLLQQQQHLLQQYPTKMFHKPLPPTPFVAQKWTSSVYPKVPGQPLSTDSGLFTEHDSSKETDAPGNQYEVPYAHLLPVGSTTSSNSSASSSSNNRFLRSSCCFTSNGPNQVDGAMTSRSGPGSGFSSEHLSYNHDKRRKYFSDYDSQ